MADTERTARVEELVRNLRWAQQRYVEIDLGPFPTQEETTLLDLFDEFDAGSDGLRALVVRELVISRLSPLLRVAAGRMQQQGAATGSLSLLRASLLARAFEASDSQYSDWREIVNGLPETKKAIHESGGDADQVFGEVQALFPGRPAELLGYYDTPTGQ